MKCFFLYLIIINVVSFAFFGVDKVCAIKKRGRISEKNLFFLSFIGGSIGAIIGMLLFRHKIRKLKFYLWNILMIYLWLFISIKLI